MIYGQDSMENAFGVKLPSPGTSYGLHYSAWTLVVLFASLNVCKADDSTTKVREGLRLYAADQFEDASKSFAAASEALEKAKSDKSAVAAFDEACALHRKGDLDLARDRYLKAGLSQDKSIATAAHFNLGVIASEQARKIAGDNPEQATEEQRKNILAELSRSIDSYRHCLEIQPKHAPARHNLELLRNWIKYFTDRWRELDLQKRRDETNLIQFIEFLMQTQTTLRETAQGFSTSTSPNAFAELRRLQDELTLEIPYLKDKIEAALRPSEQDGSNPALANTPTNKIVDEELARGIAMLTGWADEAALKMEGAGKDLNQRHAALAADKQSEAIDKLDQIWDAVVPFHALLNKELLDQTDIVNQLKPKAHDDKTDGVSQEALETETKPDPDTETKSLESNDKVKIATVDVSKQLKQQETTLRKARLLAPKAQSELQELESQPPPEPKHVEEEASDTVDKADSTEMEPKGSVPPVDPEQIKEGYRKALELAPKAVEEMESAVKQLANRDPAQAASHAEEARRILKEIQDAQPKNPDPNKQDKNQEQKNSDDDKQNKEQEQNQDGSNGSKPDPKQDEKKPGEKSDEKKDEKNEDGSADKKDDRKESQDKLDKDKKADSGKEPKISKDRMEEALRRVRERQQEIRDRDRELKARVLGRTPVDKDW